MTRTGPADKDLGLLTPAYTIIGNTEHTNLSFREPSQQAFCPPQPCLTTPTALPGIAVGHSLSPLCPSHLFVSELCFPLSKSPLLIPVTNKQLAHCPHSPISLRTYHPLKGRSYRQLVLLSGTVLKRLKKELLLAFLQNGSSRGRSGADPEYSVVERVIAKRPHPNLVAGLDEYLCKWTGLEYNDSTWVQEGNMSELDKVGSAELSRS